MTITQSLAAMAVGLLVGIVIATAIPAHSETVHVDGGCYEIEDGDLL